VKAKMAGNGLLPLLVVLLCFTGSIYAGNFTFSSSNFTAAGQSQTLSVTLDVLSGGPVTLDVVASPAGIVTLSSSSNTFGFATTWYIYATSVSAGKVTLTFSSDNQAQYAVPSPQTIYVFVNPSITSQNLYPGTSVEGEVSLDSSPNTQVTLTFLASSNIVFQPSTFTFNAGDTPYSLSYSATSRYPGTYYVSLVASGPDAAAGYVGPSPNVTFVVQLRQVKTNPVTTFSTKVGQSTPAILVYLDVAPDSGLTVTVDPASPEVVASPAVLSFTPTILALTYTLTGLTTVYSPIVYNISGPDASKYISASEPAVDVTNRTLVIPTIPSLLIGVTSDPLTVYVASPPSSSLVLSFSSLDNSVIFNPSSLTFGPTQAVGTFTVTAMNASDPGPRTVVFSLSGVDAFWYSVPPFKNFNIAGALRNVNPTLNFNTGQVPIDAPVTGYLQLNIVPPTGFTVTLTAANVVFTPSSFTFTNSTGSTLQTFSLEAEALGSSRIYYTVTGVDAAIVAPIPSQAITVVQYDAPYFEISSAIVGELQTGWIVFPSPVIDSLTVTVSASPASIPVVLTPSTFTLTSPGYNADEAQYSFSFIASSVGTVILHATTTGADVGLFPPIADQLVIVESVSFGSVTSLPESFVVDVPVTGLSISLNTPHASTVSLTPQSSASLQITPAQLVFDNTTSLVCFTIVPLVASDSAVTIVWVSSDPTNYIAPPATIFGPVVQKTFNLHALYGYIRLVVGVPSQPYPVNVNYAPLSSPIVLIPASTDGLVFNPPTLTFTPNITEQYVTITATSLDNTAPVVTWTVQGAESASFDIPDYLSDITVFGRM
jgi:hypothetical protein